MTELVRYALPSPRYGAGMSDLTKDQNDRLRAEVRAWLAADRDRSNAALAVRASRSKQTIGDFLNGKTNASHETAKRIAKAIGVPLGEILGPGAVVEVEREERYPQRAVALSLDPDGKRWGDAARQAVLAMVFASDEDPGEAYWVRALDTFEITVAGLESALPKISNKLVEVDDTEPGGPFRR